MKSKVWIYYLLLNIALVAVVGYFSYKAYFPDKVVYPDPVTLFEQVLNYGEELQVLDPYLVDNDETLATYHFSLSNQSEEELSYYLYLKVTGDIEIINSLTVKIQDKGLLISYLPNAAIKKITLQPKETLEFSVKIYIDMLQVLDTSIFTDKSITLTIMDDQVSFYGIEVNGQNNSDNDSDNQDDTVDDDFDVDTDVDNE